MTRAEIFSTIFDSVIKIAESTSSVGARLIWTSAGNPSSSLPL